MFTSLDGAAFGSGRVLGILNLGLPAASEDS